MADAHPMKSNISGKDCLEFVSVSSVCACCQQASSIMIWVKQNVYVLKSMVNSKYMKFCGYGNERQKSCSQTYQEKRLSKVCTGAIQGRAHGFRKGRTSRLGNSMSWPGEMSLKFCVWRHNRVIFHVIVTSQSFHAFQPNNCTKFETWRYDEERKLVRSVYYNICKADLRLSLWKRVDCLPLELNDVQVAFA